MLSPRLTLESLHEFYLNQYRKEHDYDHKEQMFARGIRRGKYIIDYLGELKIYDAKVIEIGCGYGGILDCFRGKGADIVGVDVDHNVEEFVLSKDIDIYIGTIESFVEERKVEKVDIIILSHVLEHVVDPVGFLQIVRVLLNNKGIIYLEVPGIDNPRVRKNNLGVQPGHLFYFNKKSLLNVCTRAGFEVIKSNNAAQFVLKLLS